VGIFDFFSRRRERESALEPAEQDAGANQPVVGSLVDAAPGLDAGQLDLSNLGSMIQSAIDSGNVTIEQGGDPGGATD
jgi:hypothetical protein